jgi:flagellar motor switch protein FliM
MNKNHNVNIDAEEINTLSSDNPDKIGNGKINRKVKTYNFRRPDKFAKDQIRTMQMMHETFSRLTTTSLSALLKALVSVHVKAVDQLTYEEFVRSIPNPTTIGIIDMNPIKAPAVLELDPSISFAMLDVISGGKGETDHIIRQHSEIELKILERIFVTMCGNIAKSWSNVLPLKPGLIKFETNPQFAQVVPPNDMIILVCMEIRVQGTYGMLNFCIPYITIHPILHKLTAKYWYSPIGNRKGLSPEMDINNLNVNSEVYFETEKISLKNLNIIKKGTLIKLPEYGEGICHLDAGGNTLYRMKQKRDKKNKLLTPSVFEIIKQKKYLKEEIENFNEQIKDNIPAIKAMLAEFESAIKEKINQLDKKINGISIAKTEMSYLPENVEEKERYENPVIPSDIQNRPLEFIQHSDVEELARLLSAELPQVTAMILSCLESGIAGSILSSFDEKLQIDISERVANIRPFHAKVLEKVAEVLKAKLRLPDTSEIAPSNGIYKISEILNASSRSAERNIIGALKKKNPEMAEDIQSSMFLFENILLFDNQSIKLILENIQIADLLTALKTADTSLQELFFRNIQDKDLAAFKEKFGKQERIRLSEVEAAQQRIIHVIREMEESGEIDIIRDGDIAE